MNVRPTAAQLIGTWDCYAPGIATELVLAADGSYVDTWYGGGTRHWGRWSIVSMSGNPGWALQLQLAGAYPTVYQGPLGSAPIQWPPYEWWPLSDIRDGQIQATSTQMIRRAAPPPGSREAPSAAPAVAQPLATPNENFAAAMDAINAANASACEAMKSLHDSQRAQAPSPAAGPVCGRSQAVSVRTGQRMPPLQGTRRRGSRTQHGYNNNER